MREKVDNNSSDKENNLNSNSDNKYSDKKNNLNSNSKYNDKGNTKYKDVKGIKINLKKSLRLRLSLIMIASVVCIIILCWVINKLFLQGVYEKSKLQAVEEAYKFIDEKFTEEVVTQYSDDIENNEMDSLFTDLERAMSKLGLTVTLYKKYEVGNEFFYEIYYPTNNSLREREHFKDKIIRSDDLKRKNIIKQTESYIIYKSYDNRLKFQNLELIGMLESGISVNLNINFEVMEESARISNRFLATIGLLVGAIASIILYFISNSVTRPVLEVSRIARKMANLDFDEKYNVVSEDEIGVLGESINSLSKKLEKTITELKNANNELKRDIKQKEEIDEMRREFLSNVSHELKTPIALIQGYAEGLSENINDDDLESRKFYCEVIEDEAKKMNNIVKKLLDLNQIEFGQTSADIVRFDIVEMIRGIISSTDILFKQKEINVTFARKKKLYVWADQYMIEEVVTNYISNALNHVNEEKKVKIEVKVNDDIARVSVFNSGSHIPDEDIDRIWDKFYKVDKARTREYGGSGVGLSIVRAIMEKHDRKCGANNVDGGVEFWFELDCKVG